VLKEWKLAVEWAFLLLSDNIDGIDGFGEENARVGSE